MKPLHIEELTQTRSVLGESPMWDVETNRLFWVDSLGRKIFRAAPDGSDLFEMDVPANLGSIALCRGGGLVGAFKNGLHFVDVDSGELTLLSNPEPDLTNNTLNDGKVDAAGRFWFGSMNITEAEPSGSLYRLKAERQLCGQGSAPCLGQGALVAHVCQTVGGGTHGDCTFEVRVL